MAFLCHKCVVVMHSKWMSCGERYFALKIGEKLPVMFDVSEFFFVCCAARVCVSVGMQKRVENNAFHLSEYFFIRPHFWLAFICFNPVKILWNYSDLFNDNMRWKGTRNEVD